MKGNRQGSLSRSIARRSEQKCKIILQLLILQFCCQLGEKVHLDFFAKLGRSGRAAAPFAKKFPGCKGSRVSFYPMPGISRIAVPK